MDFDKNISSLNSYDETPQASNRNKNFALGDATSASPRLVWFYSDPMPASSITCNLFMKLSSSIISWWTPSPFNLINLKPRAQTFAFTCTQCERFSLKNHLFITFLANIFLDEIMIVLKSGKCLLRLSRTTRTFQFNYFPSITLWRKLLWGHYPC